VNETLANHSQKGVICLFCGRSTFLSAHAEQRHVTHPEEHLTSLVRCHRCGKEALYLPQEIVDLQAA
jgi:ribosomal protein S27AE